MYQQHRPKRQEFAIKVLRPDAVQGPAKEQFETEANIMASVSTHPNIVTIYDAFEADDGRPCIVMELYPKPNFSERYRSTQFSVADALRVGIQLSGAVETAHRAGILHRDIKPFEHPDERLRPAGTNRLWNRRNRKSIRDDRNVHSLGGSHNVRRNDG